MREPPRQGWVLYSCDLLLTTQQLSHNTLSIHKRNVDEHLARRQTTDATEFNDVHYPGFYASDFSNVSAIFSLILLNTSSYAEPIHLEQWPGFHALSSKWDPFDSSVILWTRTVPKSLDGTTLLPDKSLPACVSYRVYTSALSGKPVSSGESFTSYDVDWTVKVEATGLKPDTMYFFQFADCTNVQTVSPVGTTRLLNVRIFQAAVKHVNGGSPLTFALFSCSQYQSGQSRSFPFVMLDSRL